MENATTDEEKKLIQEEITNYQKSFSDSDGQKKADAWKKLEKGKDKYLTMDALTTYSPKIKEMIQQIQIGVSIADIWFVKRRQK